MTSVLLQPRCDGVDGVGLSTLRDFAPIKAAGYFWDSQYVGYNYGTHAYALEASWVAGMPVMPNVEAEPDAAKGGYARGKIMAEKAIVDLTNLGFLGDCPVPFSAADKSFPDILGAGMEYHRALVDVFGGHGWIGGAYGMKSVMQPLSQQPWWPADWPIWHWGGDGNYEYPWAWAKQWYGRNPTAPPHPNVGITIDENTLLKPMKFWSGYGPDTPQSPTGIPEEFTVAQFDEIMALLTSLEGKVNRATMASEATEYALGTGLVDVAKTVNAPVLDALGKLPTGGAGALSKADVTAAVLDGLRKGTG